MTWGMVAGAAITVVGGAIASNQANKGAQGAANAQERAQQQAIAEQRAAREQARADLMPYQDFGKQAIPLLSQLNSGDYSGFLNSPDYLAARDLGQGQLDHSAAANGGLFGGGHTRDTMRFGSQLASQYLGNYRSSLFNQLGGGQNAAAGMGGFSTNAANQIGNNFGNIGDARSSAYQSIGNNNAQFAAGTAGAVNGLFQNYANSRTGAYSGGSSPPLAGTGSNVFAPQNTFNMDGSYRWSA